MTRSIETHALRTERTARFHTLGDPATAREVWYVLHGYGQSARAFLGEFEPLATPARLFVSPEGLSRFYLRGTSGRIGASWMTREDRESEIADYVRYLEALEERLALGPAVRRGVLGFSQGTATAGRWAVLGSRPPERLVLCSGGLPPDLDPAATRAALARTELSVVVGDADPYIDDRAVAAELARLEELGMRPRVRFFAGDHRLDLGSLEECLGPAGASGQASAAGPPVS